MTAWIKGCFGERAPVLKAKWSDWLHEYFRQTQVAVVPEVGHFVPYERSDLANAEITSFFDWISRGNRAARMLTETDRTPKSMLPQPCWAEYGLGYGLRAQMPY